jgi:hypothetical protein
LVEHSPKGNMCSLSYLGKLLLAILIYSTVSCGDRGQASVGPPPPIPALAGAVHVGVSQGGSDVWLAKKPFDEVSSAARAELRAEDGWKVVQNPKFNDYILFRKGKQSLTLRDGALGADLMPVHGTEGSQTGASSRGFR